MKLINVIVALHSKGSGIVRIRNKKKICLAAFEFDEDGKIHETRLTRQDLKANDWEIEAQWGWDAK